MTDKAKNRAFGIEYLFAALVLIIAALVIGWQLNRSIVVAEVSVYGHRLSDPDRVVQKSGLSEGVEGDSIVFLEVIEKIETLPWIRSAHVNLSYTGKLRIRVEEEDPIALLIDNGGSALISESGITLPVVLGQAVDVPILYGFELSESFLNEGRPDTLSSSSFEKVRLFLNQANQYPGLYAMISEIMVTDDHGIVVLSDENTVRLTFGRNDFDKRLRKWKAFDAQVISHKGMRQMRSLDFRYNGQVVAMER